MNLGLESRVQSINSMPLFMTNLELKWNLSGFMKAFVWELKVPRGFPKLWMEVPSGELHWKPSNSTQMFPYDGMNNQPLHMLFNIDFSSAEKIKLGCLDSFVDCRTGRCEWMAWMWSAYETSPFIHNALVTWDMPVVNGLRELEWEWNFS